MAALGFIHVVSSTAAQSSSADTSGVIDLVPSCMHMQAERVCAADFSACGGGQTAVHYGHGNNIPTTLSPRTPGVRT
eukprot:54044-Eustigmatos_ZCMA.PRE.1